MKKICFGKINYEEFIALSDQQIIYPTLTNDVFGHPILYFKWNQFFPKKHDFSEFSLALMFFLEKFSRVPHNQIYGLTLLVVIYFLMFF